MIRPEVKALFWNWREVIAALAVAALGVWWGLASFGIIQWLGWALAALGVMLALSAFQKLRFRPDTDGPGVVTIDERRVAYLGPMDGGVVDLDLMVQLDLTATGEWRLISADGQAVDIPTDAAGAEALFDVFTALPGLNTEHMLSVLRRDRPAQMTVWMAPDHKPYTLLH